MDYETFFVEIKHRVLNDLGDSFDTGRLAHLSLSLTHNSRSRFHSNDQYRSKTAKIPAYYNPNSHSVHLNVGVLESASSTLVENIYYHELVHASSHHAKMEYDGCKILKSGLKIQMWDEQDKQIVLHRGLNEGLTQYFANSHTAGGPAYRREVQIVGKLIHKIGLSTLKSAYFGPAIDQLELKMRATFGADIFQELSVLVDEKRYDEAEALIS